MVRMTMQSPRLVIFVIVALKVMGTMAGPQGGGSGSQGQGGPGGSGRPPYGPGGMATPPNRPPGGMDPRPSRPPGGMATPPNRPPGGMDPPPNRPPGGMATPQPQYPGGGTPPPTGVDQDWFSDWWDRFSSSQEGSSSEDQSSVENSPPGSGTPPGDVLNGPPGSVCPRQVLEAGEYDQQVPYPCWRDGQEISCSECGTTCRMAGQRCYHQVLNTCYRQERRYGQRWVTRAECCQGYERLGNTCQRSRYPLCLNNNGGCEQICLEDGSGGRRCECEGGFRLISDVSCRDIDECVENSGCHQGCVNTPGSFYCTCNAGFRLVDSFTCQEINECAIGNGGCAHFCHNTYGAFYCECGTGFVRVNGFECQAVDRCSSENPCSHGCISVPGTGTYMCQCPTNLQLDPVDQRTCIDAPGDVRNTPATDPNAPGDSMDNGSDVTGADEPISMPVIVGAAGGGVFLIVCIVVVVCLTRRCQAPSSQSAGAAAASAERNKENTYESTRRDNKDGAPRHPPQYINGAYDHLVAGRLTQPPPPLPPNAPPSSEYYLDILPPPYSPTATATASAPPKSAYQQPIEDSESGGVYEIMDYGSSGLPEPQAYLSPVSEVPPLPPRDSQCHHRAAPGQAGESSTAKPDQEQVTAVPLNNQVLSSAMKNLKKVPK